MKKFMLGVTTLTLAVGLAACSNSDSTAGEKKEKEKETVDLKQPMMKFYMELGKTINANDVDLNAYEGADKPDPKLAPGASTSAQSVADALKSLEIPAELKDHKADLETAVKDLADSYQVKAEELKNDKPSLDAANATFTKGEEELGKVIEAVGLTPSSLGAEVN